MSEKIFSNIKAKDIYKIISENPTLVTKNTSIDQLLQKIIEDPKTRHAYVVDDSNKLIGSIRVNSLLEYMFPENLSNARITYAISEMLFNFHPIIVEDIMNDTPEYVTLDTQIMEIVRIMQIEQINEIPVVDENLIVIGEVNFLEIIGAFLKVKNELPDKTSYFL